MLTVHRVLHRLTQTMKQVYAKHIRQVCFVRIQLLGHSASSFGASSDYRI